MAKVETSLAKSEMIYRELRDRIIAGRYSPGYRLILSQIAAEFNVSPVPVREAIRRLEAEGLVQFTRNVGAQVSTIDTNLYVESMRTLAYLEGVATSISARHMTSADIDEAFGLNERMREATTAKDYDPFAYSSLNGRFHTVLCRSCPNSHLLALINAEAERVTIIRRAEFKFNPERSKRSIDQHSQILELITRGAPELDIEMAAREHKLAALREVFDEDGKRLRSVADPIVID